MRLTTLTLFLFLVSYNTVIKAQTSNYIIKHYNTEKGLSQNDIRNIICDQDGYLWFSTNNGINRYDGYNFIQYTTGYRGLGSDMIRSIAKDSKGNLWIGTQDRGLFLYERSKDRFLDVRDCVRSIDSLPKSAILVMCDKEDCVWIGGESNIIHKITPLMANMQFAVKKYAMVDANIKAITLNDKNQPIIVCDHEVSVFDKSSDSFKTYLDVKGINQLQWIDKHVYLSKDSKAFELDMLTLKLKEVSNLPVRMMRVDSNHLLWIHNLNGVFVVDLSKADYANRTTRLTDEEFLSTLFYEDVFGNMWLGTYRKGVYQFMKNNVNIQSYKFDSSVEKVFCDSQDRLWIGTLNSKLICYEDSKLDKYTTLAPGSYALAEHTKSKVQFIPSAEKIIVIDNGLRTELPIMDITLTKEDSIYMWLGTYGMGLHRYNTVTHRIETVEGALSVMNITNLTLDSRKNLWIGTSDGLCLLKATERFKKEPRVDKLKIKNGSTRISMS